MANLRPGQGPNYGMMKYPRGQSPNQFTGGILSQPLPQGGGLHRSGSDMDKVDRKYEIGKISDEEQAKQRQLKAILKKLTPQNFDKLFEQVKAVNIDSPGTLAGVVSQIFDKALMEPAFCEMCANLCSHLANVLPDFSEDNEKITFKRLLLNKCQEEFERGECEEAEAEAEKTEEEGEVKQTPEQREEKRVKARRRMLGNIRLIGELYKKRMLTERIMHVCIKKLLGPTQSPDEDDIEALYTLISTVGEMIDHPKAKEHMDAYFDIMANLSTNQRYSSPVRFMLKDAIDLRRNKWQRRRKVEWPNKIEEVHWDAAQECQAQSSRLSRGGPVMNNPPMRRGPQMGLVSPVSQQPGIRGMAPPQSGRGGFPMQDVWFEDRGDRYHFNNRNMNPSLPLPQRVNRDESITLGPHRGLGQNMSISDQPGILNASSAMGDRMGSGPTNGFGSGTSSEYGYGSREGGMGVRMASPEERTGPPLGWGQRGLDRNFSAGSRPAPPMVNQRAGLVASSPSSTSLPDSVIKEKSDFYSAKDEKEVAMCMEELFEQVKAVNIDSPGTLAGFVSQIFDKALMEPAFCEMYANLCSHLANVLPDFSEDNEKITFKRLLLNKCREEFERGEREEAEAEAETTEEEGGVKQTPEQREEKRVKARRRMLGNIRLIGELYKKRMLTERIMHECIKKLLGPTQSPDEDDIEALCALMSTIGERIDHPKSKEYMDAYFDIIANLSTNQRYSSRVRFMLKDAIDLRRNKWQQRRKVEGPKKIEEVHWDAAQERQAQSSRLSRGGLVMNNPPMRRGPQMGLVSPVSQQPGIRGMAPPVVNQQAGLVASSPRSTSLPDIVIKEKSLYAIREFYSAKDEKEVAMCIEELKSPGSYHLTISTWVSDSFERKEMERDVLYKLLVNLCKPSGGLFPQAQIQQGLETVLSTLEDAVHDAPKAPEFLGRLFAKFIAEDVMSLEDIGRLVCEGGEEPGMLIEAGLGGDVIGCTLEYIKVEKGDSFLNDVRAGSNLLLEDFNPPPPARSKKLDPFL